MENAAIGANIRAYREASGESQKDLANSMRADGFRTWSQATVWATEAGDRPLRATELIALAEHYGFSLDEFVQVASPIEGISTARIRAALRQIQILAENAAADPKFTVVIPQSDTGVDFTKYVDMAIHNARRESAATAARGYRS